MDGGEDDADPVPADDEAADGGDAGGSRGDIHGDSFVPDWGRVDTDGYRRSPLPGQLSGPSPSFREMSV